MLREATSNQDDIKTAQRVIRYYEFSIFTVRKEADLDGVFRMRPSLWSPSGS